MMKRLVRCPSSFTFIEPCLHSIFSRNEDGNVLIISALPMPVLIGMVALVASMAAHYGKG